MDAARLTNSKLARFAPEPPKNEGNYELYARQYRVYLQLLDEFNSRDYVQAERPFDERSVTLNFASQIQAQSYSVVEHTDEFKEQVKKTISESPAEVSGYAQALVDVGRFRNTSGAPSSVTVAPEVTLPEGRRQATQRMKKIGDNPKTAWLAVPPDELRKNMLEVVDRELYDYMNDNNRLPKSYKSLYNLREMADRKCLERRLPRLSVKDWKVVTRS